MLWERWVSFNRVDSVSISQKNQTLNEKNKGFEDNKLEKNEEIPRAINLKRNLITEIDSSSKPKRKEQNFQLNNNKLKVSVNSVGGKIDYSEFLSESKLEEEEKDSVVLFDNSQSRQYEAQTGIIDLNQENRILPNHTSQFTKNLAKSNSKYLVLENETNSVKLTKIYDLVDDSFVVKVQHQIENKSDEPIDIGIYLQLLRDSGDPAGGSSFYHTYTGPVVYSEEAKFQKVPFDDIKDNKTEHVKIADSGWIGIIQHYYVSAWILRNQFEREIYTRELRNNLFTVGTIQSLKSLKPSETAVHESILYVGPQYQETLKKLAPGLDLVVDYGILTVIAKPIFWLLEKLHSFIGNWGWAIVALTIIIKLIFYPLTAASYKSMAKMKNVTPKIMQIREQNKDDKLKMNQAMMDLYKKEKINPLGGCLPILIQIPVFIALYWVLLASVEIKDAPWIFWIRDLSAPDPFFILPLIMAVTMFIQMRLNPTPPDPLQAKIMMFMPVVFSIFFFFFPAGLVLYWLVNNIVSIAQQWSIMRQLNVKV